MAAARDARLARQRVPNATRRSWRPENLDLA